MPENVKPDGARMEDVTGCVLAGGKGKRLGGVQKGLVRIDGTTIMERTLTVFEAIFGARVIVANDPAPYEGFGAPITADQIVGKGAPGGLHAALTATETGWVFLTGCDMPTLDTGLIERLAARRTDEVDAVFCINGGRPEPLFAFYHRRCLAPLTEMLQSGSPSFRDLFAVIRTDHLEWENETAFTNVNTPEDLEHAGGTLPE